MIDIGGFVGSMLDADLVPMVWIRVNGGRRMIQDCKRMRMGRVMIVSSSYRIDACPLVSIIIVADLAEWEGSTFAPRRLGYDMPR